MKKKKIETHGKIEQTKNTQPTMLEQVWGGYNELARYGTTDASAYENQLKEMNRADLETHARRVGVVIVESTARLQEKLLSEFKNYTSLLRAPKPENVTLNPSKAALKVMSEGR